MPDERAIERLALSPMQKGMLYHHLSGGPADVDLQQILLTLPEAINTDRLRIAWERLVERHPALRSTFVWEDGSSPGRIVHDESQIRFEVRDLSTVPDSERPKALEELIAERRTAGLDPGELPVHSVDLVRLAEDDYRLLWGFHHLVMDGQSTARVLQELFHLYEALAANREPELAPLPDYGDFLDWLDSRDRSGDENFWTQALGSFDAALSPPGESGPGSAPAPAGVSLEEFELRLTTRETSELVRFGEQVGVTLNALVQAAWSIVLSRFSGSADIVYGVTRAARGRELPTSGDMVGVLIQTHPVRLHVETDRSVTEWLTGLKDAHRTMGAHFLADLPSVQACSGIPPGTPLFHSLYMYDHEEMTTALRALGGAWADRELRILERPPYPLTLYAYGEPGLLLRIVTDRGVIAEGTASRLVGLLRHTLLELSSDPERTVGAAMGLPDAERSSLLQIGQGTDVDLAAEPLVHQQILALAETCGGAVALVAGDRTVTFGELAESVRTFAAALRRQGIGGGSIVGLEGDRSVETITALLGILEAGAAYLPLDPSYPESRLRFMAEDSGLSLILTGPGAGTSWPESQTTLGVDALLSGEPEASEPTEIAESDLAYLIYTSGSTGRPKGVMIEHGNVRNFLAAMDEAVEPGEAKTWLSITPLSFDISVLELLWTLSRGWRVALPTSHATTAGVNSTQDSSSSASSRTDFGLFFFAAASSEEVAEGYRLLLEGARKADAAGLASIWTPERHFHEFGGLYPNPSLMGSALAAITENLSIRAGSVVLPLHDPIRVAEEWSVVDNLSSGRAGVAFASGWQKDDFVLAPDNHENRHDVMYRGIDMLQRLWRGEEVFVPGVGGEQVGVRLYPRPVQPSLPMWLTAAGSPSTFRKAGEIGAGVLTHLLGQSVEGLSDLLDEYREARRAAGHGPGPGRVAVMLHTFIGADDEAVRALVREPLRNYLRSSVSLIKNYSGAWASKTGKGRAEADGDEFDKLSPEDLEALLDQAFERYYETSGLLGTPDKCADLVERLAEIGVDEVACLIDFGVPTDRALAGIDEIARLAEQFGGPRGSTESASPAEAMVDVPSLVARHDVTHMQCTPSLLRMLLADAEGREALASLEVLLVGGEAFPSALARDVGEITKARVLNMYGPTETTVWSATGPAREPGPGIVPIGGPIANTRLYVLDEEGRLLPEGAPGELYIGGQGVARGYHDRPELNEYRFRPDPFSSEGEARMYRTGDRVRWRSNRTLEFLGRSDQQVKLRGHRVELGEIEAALREHPHVAHAAVIIRGGDREDALVAFYVATGDDTDAASLRTWLEERLPSVMVPSLWTVLDELPLTPNGKIDRKALPAVAPIAPTATSHADTVHTLAGIWSDVLGVPDVGPQDDFFELGGNSLSTIQVAFQIRTAFGIELPLRSFFRAPTVEALAARVDAELVDQADVEDLDALVSELEGLSDDEAARLVGG